MTNSLVWSLALASIFFLTHSFLFFLQHLFGRAWFVPYVCAVIGHLIPSVHARESTSSVGDCFRVWLRFPVPCGPMCPFPWGPSDRTYHYHYHSQSCTFLDFSFSDISFSKTICLFFCSELFPFQICSLCDFSFSEWISFQTCPV